MSEEKEKVYPLNGGYQPNGRKGYQPDHGSINRSDPPDGGSGVNSNSSSNNNERSNGED
ncbi:MAG: hypothetical protein ABIL68_11215 [bacterium]